MKLSDWMAAEGLNDETLAQRANVNRATVSRVRRRKQKPGEELAARLFALTGGQVAPNDFYDLPPLPAAAREEAA